MIIDELFRFPTVLVDGDKEEQKRMLFRGGKEEPEVDIIIGESAYPYFALIGIAQRWMPNNESYRRAFEDKRFDACLVSFLNIGSFLVPWTAEKFEKEYREFVEKFEGPQKKIIAVSKKGLGNLSQREDNGE